MNIHHLKTWPEFFVEVESERKTFEIRREDDRVFKVGDLLVLKEFAPCRECEATGVRDYGDHLAPCPCVTTISPKGFYTGNEVHRIVTYKTNFGQPQGQVVLGITPVPQHKS